MEINKLVANEIFGVFEKYKAGECSYDRALINAARLINKHADERPIVGYVKSGVLKKALSEVLCKNTPNPEKPYIIDCKVHQNEISNLQRMHDSI